MTRFHREPPRFNGDDGDDLTLTDLLADRYPDPVAIKEPGQPTQPISLFRNQDTQPISRVPRTRRPGSFPVLQQIPPPPPPARQPDCAIFIPYGDGSFGLLCGVDLWRRHVDPETRHARRQFDALRTSAYRAGWRLDNYRRWCCPTCVMRPSYSPLFTVAHWHPDAPAMRAAGEPGAEAALRAVAEERLLEDVNGSAQRGKHRAMTQVPSEVTR